MRRLRVVVDEGQRESILEKGVCTAEFELPICLQSEGEEVAMKGALVCQPCTCLQAYLEHKTKGSVPLESVNYLQIRLNACKAMSTISVTKK
jgi:hypothetical protein